MGTPAKKPPIPTPWPPPFKAGGVLGKAPQVAFVQAKPVSMTSSGLPVAPPVYQPQRTISPPRSGLAQLKAAAGTACSPFPAPRPPKTVAPASAFPQRLGAIAQAIQPKTLPVRAPAARPLAVPTFVGSNRMHLAPAGIGVAVQLSKAATKPHTTKGGKIKDSSMEYLKALPKSTGAVELVGIWEVHKSLFNAFVVDDAAGLPPGTTGTLPKFLDLAALRAQYYVMATLLENALVPALTQSRGSHGNDEGKLPTYPVGAGNYEEFGYLKSGARMVVDHVANRTYISLHYSTFYRVA